MAARQAAVDNQRMARGLGIDVDRAFAITFALGSGLAGLGGALDVIPFGLTVPEMAAVMGALGARRAVLLDGGISGQLMVREGGRARRWEGLRDVPLGMIVTAR